MSDPRLFDLPEEESALFDLPEEAPVDVVSAPQETMEEAMMREFLAQSTAGSPITDPVYDAKLSHDDRAYRGMRGAPYMSREEASAIGERSAFGAGAIMSGIGYQAAGGDPFAEETAIPALDTLSGISRNPDAAAPNAPTPVAAARGTRAPLSTQSEYKRGRNMAADEEQRAAFERPDDYWDARRTTENIAALPAAFVGAVPGVPSAAAATPSALQMGAQAAAWTAPYAALEGAGTSEKEGLGAMSDAVDNAFLSSALSFAGGSAVGRAAQGVRPRSPARAPALAAQSDEASRLADRARTEAVGGTGAAYRKAAAKYGSPEATEREIAEAAERLFPGEGQVQTPADYARRAAERVPQLGEEVGAATRAVSEEMPVAADTSAFFGKLGELRDRMARGGTDSQRQGRALTRKILELQKKYEGQDTLSPLDLHDIKVHLSEGGYPSSLLEGTSRAAGMKAEREASDVTRGVLKDVVASGEPLRAPTPVRPEAPAPGKPWFGPEALPDESLTTIPRVDPMRPTAGADVQIPPAPAIPREMAAGGSMADQFRQYAAQFDVDPLAATMRPPPRQVNIPGAWPEVKIEHVLGNKVAQRAMTPASRGGGPPSPAAEKVLRRLEAPIAPEAAPPPRVQPELGDYVPPASDARTVVPPENNLTPETARRFQEALRDYGHARTIEDLAQDAAMRGASKAQFTGGTSTPGLLGKVARTIRAVPRSLGEGADTLASMIDRRAPQSADEAANFYRDMAAEYGGKATLQNIGAPTSPGAVSPGAADFVAQAQQMLDQDPNAFGEHTATVKAAIDSGDEETVRLALFNRGPSQSR